MEAFRNMRRVKQELSHEDTIKILEEGTEGILGVLGDHDYPYTVPLNYHYYNGKIYFHGAKTGHKIDAIRKHDKVSFTVVSKKDIVAKELTTYFESVIVFGHARILEDEEEIKETCYHLGMKFLDDDKKVSEAVASAMNRLAMIEMTIDHMSGKEAKELTRMRGNK